MTWPLEIITKYKRPQSTFDFSHSTLLFRYYKDILVWCVWKCRVTSLSSKVKTSKHMALCHKCNYSGKFEDVNLLLHTTTTTWWSLLHIIAQFDHPSWVGEMAPAVVHNLVLCTWQMRRSHSNSIFTRSSITDRNSQ